MEQILILEDDIALNYGLCKALKTENRRIVSCETIKAARDQLLCGCPSLILLDINLPDGSGLDFLQELKRNYPTIPVILLTANDTDMDIVKGLELGADDYITKPFNILELKARIRALLRRANAAPQQKAQSTLLTVGGVTIDPEQRVALKDGKVVELTAKEYDLIELFVKNPRRVYSRENLMDLVWGYTYAGDYRTVDVHIRRLREKLEDDPAAPQHILTKWGIGYYFKD